MSSWEHPITSVAKIPKINEKAKDFSLKNIYGKNIQLKELLKRGPVILTFYRGGWCPYCNLQLRNLQSEVVPVLKQKNGKLVAISVDQVNEALKTKSSQNLDMIIISDPKATLLKEFKIVNQMSDELVKEYKTYYYIDIEGSSGEKHHMIAVPSVFIISKNRKIIFSYSNKDYKVRAENSKIIEALRKN